MSINLEIEFKNQLTQTEYERLIKHFNLDITPPNKQTNLYFDTQDAALRKLHINFRARIKTDGIELTLKRRGETGNLEYNEHITEEDLSNLINKKILPNGNIAKELGKLNVKDLAVFAKLVTYRYEFPYEGCLLALDKSEYYDKVDYELELEVPDYDSGRTQFLKLLDDFHIPYRPSDPKIVRATKAKK